MVDVSASTLSTMRRLLIFLTFVFIVVHASMRALAQPEEYEKAAEIFTHLFAVPAILRARHMREQIIVATIVSVVYHCVRNYSSLSEEEVASYQRLDHAVSVALISTVILKYFARITHVIGIIVLLSGLSASFEWGNILSSALTALIFVVTITVPLLDQAVNRVVGYIVWILSLGGVPPNTNEDINLSGFRKQLLTALGLQILSVASYFVGENNENLQRWAHSLWHAFAFLSLFVLVDVIALREDTENKRNGAESSKRKLRKQFGYVVR